MDGVTLVFNKTYYWEVAEIEYLYSNESSNLASNSNGLELSDRRHRSGNNMSERHQGVDESFDLCLMNQTVARRDIDCKGRDGVVCYARPLLSASARQYVFTLCRVPRNGFRSNRRFHARCLRRAGQHAGRSFSKPLRRALWLQQQHCRIDAWWQRFVW